MDIALEAQTIEAHSNSNGGGSIEITVSWSIDARQARRTANRVVAERIGNLIGREPYLVVADRVVWRVPIVLAFKDVGTLGQVGTLDVDANTSEPIVTDAQIESMKEQALFLAGRTSTTSAYRRASA